MEAHADQVRIAWDFELLEKQNWERAEVAESKSIGKPKSNEEGAELGKVQGGNCQAKGRKLVAFASHQEVLHALEDKQTLLMLVY